jgi:hypothetical protein
VMAVFQFPAGRTNHRSARRAIGARQGLIERFRGYVTSKTRCRLDQITALDDLAHEVRNSKRSPCRSRRRWGRRLQSASHRAPSRSGRNPRPAPAQAGQGRSGVRLLRGEQSVPISSPRYPHPAARSIGNGTEAFGDRWVRVICASAERTRPARGEIAPPGEKRKNRRAARCPARGLANARILEVLGGSARRGRPLPGFRADLFGAVLARWNATNGGEAPLVTMTSCSRSPLSAIARVRRADRMRDAMPGSCPPVFDSLNGVHFLRVKLYPGCRV